MRVWERVGVSVRVLVRVREKGCVSVFVYVWETVRVCECVYEGEDVCVRGSRVLVW